MDNEQLARFFDWVQEEINTSQELHKDLSHTEDDEGEDRCGDSDEHRLLWTELGTTMDWIIKTMGVEKEYAS